jgi:hypothetical protein
VGKSQRNKGQSAEREFAKLIGGARVPLSGAQEGYFNDVKGLGLEWEIKRRKSGFKTIYDILEDQREKPDALAFRTDRKDWVVCMKLNQFMELMKHEQT